MSKTGKWVLELTEDASDMTRDNFVKKHGISSVDVWDSQDEDLKKLISNLTKATKIESELTPSIKTMEEEIHNGKSWNK
tara:strand:+ start:51 stop:287 length:237 start_codon:yes stop_codon:yes gene_type:complete